MAELSNKKYTKAIEHFQKIRDEFPFSPHALEVELKLGETYYRNEQYAEATNAFKDFLALHPTHERVPFAIYHLGLTFFEQFNGIERDQKNTEVARGYFESLVRDYPNSPYTGQAREKLAQSLAYLAEKELAIAAFYQRDGKYPAARDRLETVLQRYPETPAAAKALYRLGEIYRQEKNDGKAALAYEALIQHYPESDHSKEARVHLVQLQQSREDPLKALLARDNGANSTPMQNGKAPAIAAPKETPLVAKTDIVHEEPGEQKTVFRRVAGAMNPIGWFSSEDEEEEKEAKKAKAETARKESSPGLLSSLWPGRFGRKPDPKAVVKTDPELISKVDQSLEDRGIASGKNPEPPAVSLPPVDSEPPKGVTDAPALLGSIDARLKSQGKDGAELPEAPEGLSLPVPAGSRRASKPTSVTGGLLGSIDRALQEKGVEPPTETVKVPEASSTPAAKPPPEVQLEPKLSVERGPLFLEPGEYPTRETSAEAGEASKAEKREASSAVPASELPQAAVKGPPPPLKEKTPETKPAERKETDDEDEPKGRFDQIREDMESVGRVLNPFKW